MKKILENNISFDLFRPVSLIVLLSFFFFKINFEFFIPISGDEINSILVYSSNIKTIFLKNFPNNVTFLNFIGYLKTLIFGYELITFRSIIFIFILLHFLIIKKIRFRKNCELVFFNTILISSSFSFYSGQYVGYVFSSFIFVLIYYLIKQNYNEKNNKIILILLFVQIYDHLVNLYLVLPLIISLFVYSNKKKFTLDFFIYFLTPVTIFYLFSIILTGLAILKVQSVNLNFIFFFILENYQSIFINGFNQIFFYEGFVNVNKFNFTILVKNLINFDKALIIVFLICLITSIINLKNNNNKIFSIIIILHIISLILVNKNPAPRIFANFYCFYIFIILDFISENKNFRKFISSSLTFPILIFIIIIQLYYFNYLNKIPIYRYSDFNFDENKKSKFYLEKNCVLINLDFSEMQKKNFYFNYLNLCNKRFNLSEFLRYYRS